MGLKIRLARAGAKKRPYYHIVVADSRSPRDGRFIEKIGAYNPMLPQEHADRVRLVEERIKYWLSKGALPSDRIHRFLERAGILGVRPIPAQTTAQLPKAKAQARLKAAQEAAAAPAAAAAAG